MNCRSEESIPNLLIVDPIVHQEEEDKLGAFRRSRGDVLNLSHNTSRSERGSPSGGAAYAEEHDDAELRQ
jgi:hypothetical protein